MKNLLIIATLAVPCISFAGPGHGHSHGHPPPDPCKKLATKDLSKSSAAIGQCHVDKYAASGKIDSSWKNAKYLKSELKDFKGRQEWVVTFENSKGKKGKTIYVFMDSAGGFVAANFTGN